MEKQQNLLLSIEEMITQEDSFQKIMEDGIVTDEELQEQSSRVIDLLDEVEGRFKDEDLKLIQRLFAETNVLSAIYHYYELQNLTNYGSF